MTQNIPARTGIPSILGLLKKLCRLLQVFRPVVATFSTPAQLQAWDALLTACQAFEALIEHPSKGD